MSLTSVFFFSLIILYFIYECCIMSVEIQNLCSFLGLNNMVEADTPWPGLLSQGLIFQPACSLAWRICFANWSSKRQCFCNSDSALYLVPSVWESMYRRPGRSLTRLYNCSVCFCFAFVWFFQLGWSTMLFGCALCPRCFWMSLGFLLSSCVTQWGIEKIGLF